MLHCWGDVLRQDMWLFKQANNMWHTSLKNIIKMRVLWLQFFSPLQTDDKKQMTSRFYVALLLVSFKWCVGVLCKSGSSCITGIALYDYLLCSRWWWCLLGSVCLWDNWRWKFTTPASFTSTQHVCLGFRSTTPVSSILCRLRWDMASLSIPAYLYLLINN